MHLHTLTLQALGPFAGRHTVDFSRLGAGGIFLLEGPTGAGKSTIIDAIVFALYGKVASKDASEERLRSGHAAPGDETFVDLVLESGSGVYRVRRTPAYARPKQRGSGTTTQQASVKLWRLSSPDRPDDGELLSTRLDEAGLELQRVVGLDRAQFVQTVVLPQGEFAGFLRANPEDRRGLLQKVFGTEVYEQVQVRLERMRAEAGRGLEDARAATVQATDHLVGATAVQDEVADLLRDLARGSAAVDGTLQAQAREVVDALDADATAEQTRAELARAACTATAAAVEQARALLAADARRTRLRAELAELTAAEPAHAEAVARVARARAAAVVLPTLEGAERASTAAAAAARALVDARAAVPPDVLELADPSDEPEVQRKTLLLERDRCAGVRAGVARAVVLEDELGLRREQVAAAERTRTERSGALAALDAERAALPGRRAALAEQLTAVSGATGSLEAAEERLRAVAARFAAASQVVALTAQVRDAEVAVTSAASAAEAAVGRAADVQRARIAGIAGELASVLEPGSPCAVCGGTEHPAPAPLDPAHVTPEDVEAAEAERARAQEVLTRATTGLTEVRERLAAEQRAAGGDLATVRQDHEAAMAAVEAARVAVAEHARLSALLTGVDAEAERLEGAVEAARSELNRAALECTALQNRLLLDEAAVAEARGDFGSVRERLEDLERRIDLVTHLSDALEHAAEATSRSGLRADELDAALTEHGFADAEEVRAAALPPADLAALDRAATEYAAGMKRVRAGLVEPEVADLPDVVQVDLGAVEAAHAEAEDASSGAAGAAARARHLATAGTTAMARLDAAVGGLVAAHATAGPVVRMANLASGSSTDNAKQLTLATYVLMRRFEDVVAAANTRLATMSDGRYELVRSDEREAVRTRRTGLAMKVVDHRTGVDRDPRTLSGGETFYVSLCLALGLADVVTAEAGGVDLGTLFVDEGFGSLDAETLDVVLAELGRLREGGRVVGVVSHVETLKQAIAERVEVRRLPGGASTLTVRA